MLYPARFFAILRFVTGQNYASVDKGDGFLSADRCHAVASMEKARGDRALGMRNRGAIHLALVAFLTSVIAPAGPASAIVGPPAPETVAPSVPLKPYRINPGDEIEVYVWGDERLQRALKVLPDGSISFPLVGRIDALNKLPTDIEGVIVKGLADQYRNGVPRVTVSVKSPSGLTYSVAGKVKNPGSFTPGHYVNVLEAVSVAGGPTEFADLARTRIYRKQGGSLVVIDVKLDNAMKGSPTQTDLASGLVELQSGDVVVVP
jgi:polysaccharide export outer membrane protein